MDMNNQSGMWQSLFLYRYKLWYHFLTVDVVQLCKKISAGIHTPLTHFIRLHSVLIVTTGTNLELEYLLFEMICARIYVIE
jgi:hypothetical protein